MSATVLATLFAIGFGLSMLASTIFQMVTGRVPSLAFEDGDDAAVPLAIIFRLIAGPSILTWSYARALAKGNGDAVNFAGAAFGLLWAAGYGLGLGAIA